MTSLKNETRIAQKSDYDAVRALWDKTFEEDSDAWRDWYFEYIYRPNNALLAFAGDRLVSMSHMNPYPMMLNGKKISSAALAGVATEKNERGKGYAARLIKESLKEMKKRGIAFSFLYPFNYDFYRKYGYELCYENKVYTVSGEPEYRYDTALITDRADTSRLYTKYCEGLNGHIIRSAEYQAVKLRERLADNNKIYLISDKGDPAGYALAEDTGEKIVLGELISSDPLNAAKSVSAMLGKPVEFTSPYEYTMAGFTIKPHCMGRIVDVTAVFGGAPAKDGEMVVRITDDIIAENNGNFHFKSKGGRLHVAETDGAEDMAADIKYMVPAAVGFNAKMDENVWRLYSTFFAEKTPWISEVC